MKWKTLALIATLLAAAGAGAEERSVRVPGDRSWTSTGIRVRAGDRLDFRASGEIGWGRGSVGPAGSRHESGGFFRPLGAEPLGGLIGKVGTATFWIGASAEVEAPADGELELGINDDKVSDNDGEFRVRVRFESESGWRASDSGSGYASGSGSGYGSSASDDWDRYRDYDPYRDKGDRRRDWFWWRGRVDGVDHLVVRRDTLRVQHLDKQPIQSQEHRFSDALPEREVEDLRLETKEARGQVRLLQRPSRVNDWTAIILLDDSDKGGDAWYELLLSWDRARGSAGAGYDGLFRWRGQVDVGCRISIRGKTSSVEDRGGRGTDQKFADFTVPLPSSDVPVSLRKVRGRGQVRLVESPSRANGYTAVVEIQDSKGGADLYEFELGWRR